jgi:hypothetical protein
MTLRLLGSFFCFSAVAYAAGPSFDEVQPLLSRYCLDCHDADTQKGEVDLSRFSSVEQVQKEFQLWQTVLQQVEEEEMPPKKPLPETVERAALVSWVRTALDGIDWSKQTPSARVPLPRLTKLEYNNTLRDLLGIDFLPAQFLLDDGPGASGFTNDRDALFISPTLSEQLFDAAEYALTCAQNVTEAQPYHRHYETEKMLMTERGAVPDTFPAGGSGFSLAGAGQRTLFDELTVPVDGWYRLKVAGLGRGGDSAARLRIDEEVRADFYMKAGLMEEQSVELLLRAGTHQMTWNIHTPRSLQLELKAKKAAPPRGKGKSALPPNARQLVADAAKKNAPRLPAPAGANQGVASQVNRLNQTLHSMQMRLEYLRLVTPAGPAKEHQTYFNLLPERTVAMAQVKAVLAKLMSVPVAEIDKQLLAANAEKYAANQRILAATMEALGMDFSEQFLFGGGTQKKAAGVGAPHLDWISVEGPITPAGAKGRDWFKGEAAVLLTEFLRTAFRRPLMAGELERHLALYQKAKGRGDAESQALKLAYTAALASPSFMYRDEVQITQKVSAHPLASRLSYFLWMSSPDAELTALADSGALLDETTLKTQVKRMIADERLRSMSGSFLGQWLGFSGLGTEHVPDARKFRDFTPELAKAMKLEPVMLFERLLREGGSLSEMLGSTRSFANDELAALYGLPAITGGQMQPVQLDATQRGGLLGMAAILTTSSTPNRTSPVLRGKWVLENLLGRHLAEPPADAGQLDDKAGERGKTLREELAAHRRNESCAGCHDKIDPIGFGLENFDAIGRYRSEEADRPVDASGELPGGIKFSGPAELREIIQTRHLPEFMKQLTRKLTSFALGRALQPQDEGLIRKLLADAESQQWRADALVQGIVLSSAFRGREE